MKIAYIANTSIPSHVPSSLQIVKTCEFLVKEKNKVNLILPNTAQSNISIFNFYNVKNSFQVTRIKKFNSFPLGINYYLYSLISFFRAYRSSNLIISRNYFIIFLCTIFKKKCIFELHHDISTESRLINVIFKCYNVFKKKSLLKIIAITKTVKKKYLKDFKIPKKKILVLPSGTSINLKFKKSLKKDKLKIGYFGSINKSKGIDLIVKLAGIDRQNIYFICGGKKEQILEYTRKNFLPNLFILPHKNYKELPKLLTKMDILLLPYTKSVTAAGNVSDITNYTSPLKLFDYMAAGKLIMSSNIKVLKEILKDEYDCIFIKNYLNPFGWLKEIRKIQNNILKRNIIAKNSFIKVDKYHHKKRVMKYLEAIN